MARVVVVVASDGVQLLDVSGPVEVLAMANGHGADYVIHTVSPTGADVVTSAGVRIGGGESTPDRIDTLIVPGWARWWEAVADQRLMNLVKDLAGRSRRVVSVCAGAFLLAEAGLLTGRRATTHWQLAKDLAVAYPEVEVEADPLFVRDGSIVTSAGITAGIDLTLALVEEDHGADVARTVAQYLVVFMARPGGQSQFSARLGPAYSSHTLVRKITDLVSADPAGNHTLDSLARQAGVSTRHLTRLFRAELGTTPTQFVETVRFEAARSQLESTTDSIDDVAAAAGFGSTETMRRTFQNTLGIPPTTYRARFRTTKPAPERGAGLASSAQPTV